MLVDDVLVTLAHVDNRDVTHSCIELFVLAHWCSVHIVGGCQCFESGNTHAEEDPQPEGTKSTQFNNGYASLLAVSCAAEVILVKVGTSVRNPRLSTCKYALFVALASTAMYRFPCSAGQTLPCTESLWRRQNLCSS